MQSKSTLSLSRRNALNGATVLNGVLGHGQSPFPTLTANFVDRVFGSLSVAAKDAARPGLCDPQSPTNTNLGLAERAHEAPQAWPNGEPHSSLSPLNSPEGPKQ